jgi:hypothetical protein
MCWRRLRSSETTLRRRSRVGATVAISIKRERETSMRSFLLIASAILAFGATMVFETTDANAVVCARGVYRAGCAGPNAAVVVRKPPVACRTVLVNGVWVKRCA